MKKKIKKPTIKFSTMSNVLKGSVSNRAICVYWSIEEQVAMMNMIDNSIGQFNKWKYSDE